ncbi:MAG: hypothetical protein CBC65_001200 [Rhodothermaceae bacterium TMED105]|jgi:hypothetical protein|nr:MAG: hypothetical protein CBC65_001200 [Rhodothermaceae bacterium TMED105]|tara:strand:- start:454 stop:879 length:426 start_codon:yes stop_codon:yes gene_type:complete
MEDLFWVTLALGFEVFFVFYVLTMEEDERLNGARQSRITVRRTEKQSAMKNEGLVSAKERRRKRKRRMRLRIEKLQGSQEVNDYLTESTVCFSSGDECKSAPEVSVVELPPLVICGEEWDTVSHPSSPDPVERVSWFRFWK